MRENPCCIYESLRLAHSFIRALLVLAICKFFPLPSLPACISCIRGRHCKRELLIASFKSSQGSPELDYRALKTECLFFLHQSPSGFSADMPLVNACSTFCALVVERGESHKNLFFTFKFMEEDLCR